MIGRRRMHKLQTVYVTLRGCASGPIYSFFGGLGGCRGENDANRGKHRTEVTEVTEGDWGWSVDSVASVRETRELGQSIAQRSQRGIGVGRWTAWLPCEKRAEIGVEHRTEVTEVTEGDWGWSVDSVASVRETRVEIGGDAFPPSRGPRPEADGVHGPAFSH
jgi:hypothetical protein